MSRDERSPVEVAPPRGLAFASFFKLLTVQDIFMVTYLLIVWRLLFRVGSGPEVEFCARRVFACIAVVLLGCWCARASHALPFRLRWVLYRAALAGVLLENYLLLREILPVIRPDAVDEELLQIDLRLFGVEPALWLERLNERPIVEYFSFFYFSYFFICLVYLVTIVLLMKGGTRTTEFSIGTLIVFCFGQLGYMAVPAFGPIRYLVHQFHGPVDGGFFWGCVSSTVEAGSAMKDVFPSLHTAVPTWFTFFSWHQAKTDRRFVWPARITGFFAANIIFSTMFLRWHYAIDIVAGLALSTTAGVLAPRIVRMEEAWRKKHGFSMPWAF